VPDALAGQDGRDGQDGPAGPDALAESGVGLAASSADDDPARAAAR